MARIADEVIERIKAEVSLERLVEAFGVELKKHGKDKVGRCPFHDDRTPSLVVSPQTNLWHCLGACGEGGSVIDWVMKTQGVSFRHAVELLRDDVAVLATDHPVESMGSDSIDLTAKAPAERSAGALSLWAIKPASSAWHSR